MTAALPDVRHARSVLFVCLGNICRSPLAQGVLEHLAVQRGLRDQLLIESRGTGGWHVGELPDPRTIDIARRHGIVLRSRARLLDPSADFPRFDLLLAMDSSNLSHMLASGAPTRKAMLFRTFDPELSAIQPDAEPLATGNRDVPDPYHGGPEGFELGYRMVHRTATNLLDRLFPPGT